MSDVLHRIEQVVEARKRDDPRTSYVASLHAEGLDRILRKVGEEAIESLLAARSGEHRAIVHETADLWFHSLVMLAACEVPLDEVLAELERRFGRSGHDEKAARS